MFDLVLRSATAAMELVDVDHWVPLFSCSRRFVPLAGRLNAAKVNGEPHQVDRFPRKLVVLSCVAPIV
jgi:hypothetical protein